MLQPSAVFLLYCLIATTLIANGAWMTLLAHAFQRRPAVALLGTSLSLLPLTLANAHEAFWILYVQQMIVLLGLCWPGRDFVKVTSGRSTWQFDIAAVLVLIAVFAILVGVFVTTKPAAWYQWLNMLGLGFVAGVCTLLCRRAIMSDTKARDLIVILIFSAIGAKCLSVWDRLIPSLRNEVEWWSAPDNAIFGNEPSGLSWWTMILALVVGMVAVQWLFYVAISSGTPAKWTDPRRRWVQAMLIVCLILVASFPAYIYVRLLLPDQPLIGLSEPNPGYNLLVQAGLVVSNSDLLNDVVDPKSLRAVEVELEQFRPQFDAVTAALTLSCHCVVDPNQDPSILIPSWLDDFGALRSLARALGIRSRYQRERGNWSTSLEDAMQIHRVGIETSRGGLMLQSLVGKAIQNIGHNQLARALMTAPAGSLQGMAKRLEQLFARQEPIEFVELREAAWTRNAYGWFGRLPQMLGELSGTPAVTCLLATLAGLSKGDRQRLGEQLKNAFMGRCYLFARERRCFGSIRQRIGHRLLVSCQLLAGRICEHVEAEAVDQ
jgi:hypothetical protein